MEQTAAQAAAKPSISDLLAQVTKELNDCEAKKLGEFKTELEAFIKKEDGLVSDYRKKYPKFLETWCAQHQKIETLSAALKCAFPKWKDMIKDCVCVNLKQIEDKQEALDVQRNACKGAKEKKRDEDKAKFDAAKARLDALLALGTKIDAALNADDKLIKDIQTLLPGVDQGQTVFLFWFKLLPEHLQLTPEFDANRVKECIGFAAGETPEELCGKPVPKPVARPAPWLVDPDKYQGVLDQAWLDYNDAKKVYANSESDFKSDPDDVASVVKQIDELSKTLDDRIKACLSAKKPADTCCQDPGGGGAKPGAPPADQNGTPAAKTPTDPPATAAPTTSNDSTVAAVSATQTQQPL